MLGGAGSWASFARFVGADVVISTIAEPPVYKGGGFSFAAGLGGERVGGKR